MEIIWIAVAGPLIFASVLVIWTLIHHWIEKIRDKHLEGDEDDGYY